MSNRPEREIENLRQENKVIKEAKLPDMDELKKDILNEINTDLLEGKKQQKQKLTDMWKHIQAQKDFKKWCQKGFNLQGQELHRMKQDINNMINKVDTLSKLESLPTNDETMERKIKEKVEEVVGKTRSI